MVTVDPISRSGLGPGLKKNAHLEKILMSEEVDITDRGRFGLVRWLVEAGRQAGGGGESMTCLLETETVDDGLVEIVAGVRRPSGHRPFQYGENGGQIAQPLLNSVLALKSDRGIGQVRLITALVVLRRQRAERLGEALGKITEDDRGLIDLEPEKGQYRHEIVTRVSGVVSGMMGKHCPIMTLSVRLG